MHEPIFEIRSYNPRTRAMRAQLHPTARVQRAPWRWPLARIGNRDPIVLAEHVKANRRGVDLGYVVAPFDNELYVPVHAAQSGEVSFACEGKDGCSVSIDHGELTTHYAHMSKMFVTPCRGKRRRRQHVPAGEIIGYAARDPLHVRFELWEWTDDHGFVAIDPVPHLKEWPIVSPDIGLRVRPNTSPSNEAA